VYELQWLRQPPALIVLSACELAIPDTHPGPTPPDGRLCWRCTASRR
jgi:hypothetical protein